MFGDQIGKVSYNEKLAIRYLSYLHTEELARQ